MIGTADGFWWCINSQIDDKVDYEFFHDSTRVGDGMCSDVEMFRRFDRMVEVWQHVNG